MADDKKEIIGPTTGEALLQGDIPNNWGTGEWVGRGGSQKAAEYYAWRAFADQFGRNPTRSELNLLSASYMSGDPNIANVSGGNAAVSQYYQLLANSPDRKQKTAEADLTAKIPQQYDAVKGAFQSALGRDPSQQELDHFAKMMANDQADAYSIQQGLQTLPEYTNAKDEQARTKLRGELQAADTDYLTKQVAPALQSRFAQQGRVADSSSQALAAALSNAAKETNNQREQYLATVGREDYLNARQATINNYMQNLQRQYQLQDSSTARQNQLQDQFTARNYDMQDYAMQQNAYNQYLQNYGRRQKSSNGLFSGGGALLGAGLGAALAAPTGGMSVGMGALLGSSLGGSTGRMFDY